MAVPPEADPLTETAKPLGAIAGAAFCSSFSAVRICSSFCTPSSSDIWLFPFGGVPGQRISPRGKKWMSSFQGGQILTCHSPLEKVNQSR
eukprot:5223787-Pyramimonas_sp.AAC.1